MHAAPTAATTERRPSIGCFGLGTMGMPIARRLADAGYAVAAADPDAAAMADWTAYARSAGHPPAVAEVVVTCVTDEHALEVLLFGSDGLSAGARSGQLFIDHTTTSPAFARRVAAALASRGAHFVDAPVSGAAAGARAGTLSVFAGGERDAVNAASTVLAAYAARVTHLGPAGSGQSGKLANQIAIAGIVRGLAEAVGFGRGTGLDVAALLVALAAGSARSDQLAQHATRLAAPPIDFAAAFGWLAKDVALALDEAQARAIDLPQTELVGRLLAGSTR